MVSRAVVENDLHLHFPRYVIVKIVVLLQFLTKLADVSIYLEPGTPLTSSESRITVGRAVVENDLHLHSPSLITVGRAVVENDLYLHHPRLADILFYLDPGTPLMSSKIRLTVDRRGRNLFDDYQGYHYRFTGE
ncbi:hypothetical protein C8F01DRAFT_1258536 [Mycena amicta]|nr:hypothetical protein C8F01DRAFT_1258536 [Mycena amicta]